MKENEKKETTSIIAIEVKTQNYNSKGELIDAIATGAKLTKADAGRLAFEDTDSLTFKSIGCGCPEIEVDHNGISHDILSEENARKSATIEIDVKAQVLNIEKKELVDVIVADSKLTKIDSGRLTGQKSEEWFNLQVEGACGNECGKTELRSNSKLTKTEAGKTE